MGHIEIRKSELQKLVDEYSVADVAARLGVSVQTVYNLIERHGLTKPDRSKKVVVIDE